MCNLHEGQTSNSQRRFLSLGKTYCCTFLSFQRTNSTENDILKTFIIQINWYNKKIQNFSQDDANFHFQDWLSAIMFVLSSFDVSFFDTPSTPLPSGKSSSSSIKSSSSSSPSIIWSKFTLFYEIECWNPSSISPELKISVNLFDSKRSVWRFFVLGMLRGGGNKGSMATLNAFSIMFGMILASSGLDNSKQGLLLT